MSNRHSITIFGFCFSILMLLAIPMTSAKTISVDGDTSDWIGLSAILTDPDDYPWDGLDVKEVYVTHDADYLYVRIDFYGTFSANTGTYTAYLDTDQNTGTGSTVGDIGADVQFGVWGGSGYGYVVSTGASFIVDFASSGSVLELRVPLSDVGNPSSFDVVVMCYPMDGGTPASSYLIGSNPQTITVDGSGGDWTGLPFFTDDSGDAVTNGFDLTDCWIGDNGANLYFRLDTSGAIDTNAQGDIWIYYDTISLRVPSDKHVKSTVIESWIALTDLGSPSPSEVYPMFYILGYLFADTAPDSGHETYVISVGGYGYLVKSSGFLISYFGLTAGSALCIMALIVFYKKLKS